MTTNLSKYDRPSEIRVFVALELPPALRDELSALQLRFGRAADAARWVAAELLHVTVRFIGGVSEERAAAVIRAAQEAAQHGAPFSLSIGALGAFPHERSPRVIWIGLEGASGRAALQALHTRLEAELAAADFTREDRAFSPHITLARAHDRAGAEGRRLLGEALVQARSRGPVTAGFDVDHLTVMRSDLRAGGPRYTPLARVPLQRENSYPAAEPLDLTGGSH